MTHFNPLSFKLVVLRFSIYYHSRNSYFVIKKNTMARMPRKELLPLRSSLLRTARNFLKELPINKDGEDLPKGTSLRRGGEGWRVRKFLDERRGRIAMNFLDVRKFLASRIFLEIRMAIEELPLGKEGLP